MAQVGFEDDADGFNAAKLRAGALFGYASELRRGPGPAEHALLDGGWSTDAPAIIGVYRNQRRDTLEGVRAEGGLVQVHGYTRVVGDATWGHRPRETTGVELILAGDLVGTRAGAGAGHRLRTRRREHRTTVWSSVYGRCAGRLATLYGRQFPRIAARGMIWSLLPEQGISAQLRWRQYSSSDADVGGAYFNPDRYRTWDAVLSLRRRVGTWIISGLAGGGQERVDDGSWQSTGVAEASCGRSASARHSSCLQRPCTATRRVSLIRRTTGTAPSTST